MNFDFFDSLSASDAHEHLQGFLDTEHAAIMSLSSAAEQAGILMDFSIATLPSVLKWILTSVRIFRVPVPATEPAWVQQAHKGGLIDFPSESKYMILRAAYYLGECFVRSNGALRWTIGDSEYVQKNMPVVAGFRSGEEMAPMMVCENVFGRILGDGAPESHIDIMVQCWTGKRPST
jgi:hypothetical protein